MESAKRNRPAKHEGLVLGLSDFAKISAVEGVHLQPDSERMFSEFERRGLSIEQRRRAIAEKHARKA
jgi:hypothetical protein